MLTKRYSSLAEKARMVWPIGTLLRLKSETNFFQFAPDPWDFDKGVVAKHYVLPEGELIALMRQPYVSEYRKSFYLVFGVLHPACGQLIMYTNIDDNTSSTIQRVIRLFEKVK